MPKTVYLSDMERRLLRFLMLNGAHYSIYELGERLRISPQTVAYKIKQFEKQGVILSYRYRVNPYKVGFKNMAWCALDITKRWDKEDIEKKMLSHPNIFSVLALAGHMDMFAKVYYSEHSELRELIEWLGLSFKEYVSSISIIPVMQVEKLYQTPGINSGVEKLDETSMAVLKYKLSHVDDSLKETAEALGLHRNTVSRRWGELWKKGVLLKKSLFIDPKAYNELGFGISSCLFIDAMPGRRERAVKELLAMEEVHELFSLAFRHDLLAITRTSDINHCYDHIRRVYATKHVNDTETLVILARKEKSMFPLPIH